MLSSEREFHLLTEISIICLVLQMLQSSYVFWYILGCIMTEDEEAQKKKLLPTFDTHIQIGTRAGTRHAERRSRPVNTAVDEKKTRYGACQ